MHTFNMYFTDGIILLNTISICNILDTFSITSPSGRSSPVICGTNAVCYNQLFLVILTSLLSTMYEILWGFEQYLIGRITI